MKRLLALLSIMCGIFLLTACGAVEEGEEDLPPSPSPEAEASGIVYVPQFMDCDMDQYNIRGCTDGQYLYCAAGDSDSEEAHTSLFRVSLADGAAEELEGYTLPDEDGGWYLENIRSGGDGTLWVTERSFENAVFRRLDSTGKELERVELPGLYEKLGGRTASLAFDQTGNIYVFTWDKLAVLDQEQNILFELDCGDMWGSLVQMADGSMAMFSAYSNPETYALGSRLRLIDLENQDWGAVYELGGDSVMGVIPGSGDELFYYQNGDSVYVWKAGAAEGERLFSLLSAGLDQVRFLTVLPDGRAAALTGDGTVLSLAVLTPTDAGTLPEKTILTLAAFGLDYDAQRQIAAFNRTSDTCRIEVTDYSEYDTGGNLGMGLMKLNTEIIAGNLPDLFYTDNLPIDRYAAKGILEDLWPYIDADAGIGGRTALMERVLDAAALDGKLYEAFSGFGIRTAAGSAAVVGERMSWTLAELQETFAAMPEGSTVFGVDCTQNEILAHVLSMNLSQFMDWEAGQCSFDSGEFKALLSFCGSFPVEFRIGDEMLAGEFTRLAKGKQLLIQDYITSFARPQFYKKLLGGEVSFVGYPKEDGSAGSCFAVYSGSYAMSAACKEKAAAWSFLRRMFLSRAEECYDKASGRCLFPDFPVNKSDFERMKEDSVKECFVTDEEGQRVPAVLDRQRVNGRDIIEVCSVTQEEVDQVIALYEAVSSIDREDESVYQIVQESAGMYFAGDKDLDAAASEIQDRVWLYMGENR